MPCPFKGGPYYAASFAQGGRLRSELYIDYPDEGMVVNLFEKLSGLKDTIESVYGGHLSWEELPGRRARRIADYNTGDVTDAEAHDSCIDWFFDSGTRLRSAIQAAAATAGVGGSR
jgi:hypothetical protein